MKLKPWLLAVLLLPLLSCRPGADFKVSVRVIDEATGKPIPDAWVLAAVAVKVEPEREPPYNRAVAGARAKTDRNGVAVLKKIEGIYWGEEPKDKLWLMLESRKPKLKRRITLIKEGDLFVFAKDYGALHHPLHFKGTPQEHAGMGPFGIKGEDSALLLDSAELKAGAVVTVKMNKQDMEYLYGSFHPDTFLPAIWAATSQKTGASKAEKRAVYDFFVRNLAPLDMARSEGAYRGHIKPEALLDPEVIERFVNHAPARDQSTAVQEWMTQKALELLPPGYEEVKEYAQEILAGVREEEEGDRPLNHYYDPSDPDKATAGGETALKWGAIGYPDNPRNEWDWEDALRYYRAGEKARAYRALGHVVHLLADMTNPKHTRITRQDASARAQAANYERRLTDLFKANGGALPPGYAVGAKMPEKPLPPRDSFAAVARAAAAMDASAEGQGQPTMPQGISATAGLMGRFLSAGSPGFSAKGPSQTSSNEASDAALEDSVMAPSSASAGDPVSRSHPTIRIEEYEVTLKEGGRVKERKFLTKEEMIEQGKEYRRRGIAKTERIEGVRRGLYQLEFHDIDGKLLRSIDLGGQVYTTTVTVEGLGDPYVATISAGRIAILSPDGNHVLVHEEWGEPVGDEAAASGSLAYYNTSGELVWKKDLHRFWIANNFQFLGDGSRIAMLMQLTDERGRTGNEVGMRLAVIDDMGNEIFRFPQSPVQAIGMIGPVVASPSGKFLAVQARRNRQDLTVVLDIGNRLVGEIERPSFPSSISNDGIVHIGFLRSGAPLQAVNSKSLMKPMQ